MKDEVLKEWYREWIGIGKIKARAYINMRSRDKLDKVPENEFFKAELSRGALTTIARLRSGHFLSPEHLYKINIKENSNCNCDEHGNLCHILFSCRLNYENCSLLYDKLVALNLFKLPINVYEVIFSKSEKAVQIIFEFLVASGIKL